LIGIDPKYKVLWTWDYCVLWDDSYFVRGNGATGENRRRAYFLRDYKRMVDFCAERGINGIVIWGALREHDDGVAQFRELVGYGKRKGVRIMPGIGVFAYGGVFYDPRAELNWMTESEYRNPCSLSSWLRERPELAAIGRDGKPLSMNIFSAVACPSKRENLEWFKRSFEWLCDEFQIEGTQIEVGDYALCYCEECGRRREGAANSVFMVEDMIEPYAAAYEIMKKTNADPWVICETYSSFAKPTEKETVGRFGGALDEKQMGLLRGLPDGAVVQWAMDWAVPFEPTQEWRPEDVRLPNANNIARIHHGSQHSRNSVDEWAVQTVGEMVRKSRASGVNGVSIFGEESPASPPNEANYLVFSEFSGSGNPNPECDLDLFFSKTLDPLYGGAGMAKEWRRIYITAHTMRMDLKAILPEIKKSPFAPFIFHHNHYEIVKPDLLETILKMSPAEKRVETIRLAAEARSHSSAMSGETCRRWAWLENWLWRAEFLHRMN